MRLMIMTMLFALAGSLQAETIDAKDFSLDDYKGSYVYLDFWASWCGPCRASFPWMNYMHKHYADKGLKIIAVNLDAEREEADEFLQKFPADFTIVFDQQATLAEQRNLLGMPSSFLIGPDGEVVFSHVGFKLEERDELKQKIEKVLTVKGAL